MKKSLLISIGLGIMAILSAFAFHSYSPDISTNHKKEYSRTEAPSGYKYYRHVAYGFSLLVPEEMEISTHREPNQSARTLVFAMPGDQTKEFQIYVLPYEEGTIMSSRIDKDTNGTMIGEPREVIIGSNMRTLMFESQHPLQGRLLEVWFLLNGQLFEVTTYAGNEAWLTEILNTLENRTI